MASAKCTLVEGHGCVPNSGFGDRGVVFFFLLFFFGCRQFLRSLKPARWWFELFLFFLPHIRGDDEFYSF